MEKKEHIIKTATELLLKEGVKRVTMDELAFKLGMSKRTIYETFSNKDELLKECIEDLIANQRVVNQRIGIESPTAIHAFFAFLKVGLENMKDSNPYFASDVQKYYPKVWQETLCKNYDYNLNQLEVALKRGVDEGVFRDDIKVNIVSKLLLEQLSLMADSRIFPPNIYPPNELLETQILTFIRGIASDKGHNILEGLQNNRE